MLSPSFNLIFLLITGYHNLELSAPAQNTQDYFSIIQHFIQYILSNRLLLSSSILL